MTPRLRATAVSHRTARARTRPPLVPLALATLVALGACSSDDDDGGTGGGGDVPVLSGDADFTLQLLHFADVDGTGGALDDVAAFSALVDGYRAEFPDNTVLLSSGDNFIPGPRFVAASDDALATLLGIPGEGRGDIAFLNAFGVQASAVGNHDLDRGPGALAELIAPASETDEGTGETREYVGATFPYLSANLDFAADEDLAPLVAEGGQSAASIAGRVAPSATIDVDGETIGVVGATTPALASITSTGGIGVRPADPADLDALAAEIQPAVDALTAAGIDKIVLLAHMQQIDIERALATRLTDVDIIVAGGSNTILADANDTLRAGDTAAGTYPLQFASASDEPVLLVNTDGDYRYLGRLVVGFDAEGRVLNGELDDTLDGARAATEETVTALGATPIPGVVALSQALRDVLETRDGNLLGRTDVYLDGRRSEVRTEETNLGDLTADANLWLARQADPATAISIKNGGGIRAPIGVELQPPGTTDPDELELLPPQANATIGRESGDISQLDIETALRFDNGLTLLTVTATELQGILEHAVAATEAGATPGQFPQVGGLAFSFDPSEPAREGGDSLAGPTVAGSRVRTLDIVDAEGNVTDPVIADGAIVGDASRTFRLVILDFIASCVGVAGDADACGDGYPLRDLADPARVDLADAGTDPGLASFADAGGEQDALAEYLAAFYPAAGDTAFDAAETSPAEDTRIVNIAARAPSE